MKTTTFKAAMLPLLLLSLPTSALADNGDLQQELAALKARLAELEKRSAEEQQARKLAEKKQAETKSTPILNPQKHSLSIYGTLRPTFGVTSTDKDDVWDVGDALSRIGFKTEHQLKNGWTGYAKGEFKVNIQGNGDFGEARKAYVGIGHDTYGRFTIGKQASTQYNMIADPVDIFNRAATPLAYDFASPFRTNNLVTYRNQIGNWSVSVDSQFNGADRDSGSDFYNYGIGYKSDAIRTAVAYYNRDLSDGGIEKTLGFSVAKSFGDLYLASSYQDREVNSIDGSTLDVVAAYAINDSYKVKFGLSSFDDGIKGPTSAEVDIVNATVEWHGSPDFYMFLEYQNNDYKHLQDRDSDQVNMGFRYNFDYKLF